jgi:hypothetical protein
MNVILNTVIAISVPLLAVDHTCQELIQTIVSVQQTTNVVHTIVPATNVYQTVHQVMTMDCSQIVVTVQSMLNVLLRFVIIPLVHHPVLVNTTMVPMWMDVTVQQGQSVHQATVSLIFALQTAHHHRQLVLTLTIAIALLMLSAVQTSAMRTHVSHLVYQSFPMDLIWMGVGAILGMSVDQDIAHQAISVPPVVWPQILMVTMLMDVTAH